MTSYSQELSEKEEEVHFKAMDHFVYKEFKKAQPLFSQLLSLYPKNLEYNYAYAVCLIETNTDTKKAIDYLKYVEKNNNNPLVNFYLGRAYHLNYDFQKAFDNFQTFKKIGNSGDVQDYQADYYLRMCANGLELLQYISDLIVLDNRKISKDKFYYSYDIDDYGGKIIQKTEEFLSRKDKKHEEVPLMYLSDKDYVFYSSYVKKDNKDIFMSYKMEDGTWSEPQNLGPVINTPYFEDYPFIHNDGKTLYFCSKGHMTMGGYDIFKSEYDSVKMEWTKPINLDFPTNSPYDDILYITDTTNTFAYFASDRETDEEKYTVYKIEIDKNPEERKPVDVQEIIAKSELQVTPLAMRSNTNNNVDSDRSNNSTSDSESQKSERLEYNFNELSSSNNLKLEDIINEASKDAEEVKEQAKEKELKAQSAYILADKKNKEADEKRQKANNIRNSDKNKAEKLDKEADDLEQEAILAYNVAKNLEKSSELQKKDIEKANAFAENLKNIDDKDLAIESINKNRKEINENTVKYSSLKKEISQKDKNLSETKQKSEEIVNKLMTSDEKLSALKSEIEELEKRKEIAPDDETREKINEKIQTKEEDLEKIKNEINDLYIENQKLLVDKSQQEKELNILNQLNEDIQVDENTEKFVAKNIDNINKEELEKTIFNKELVADNKIAERKTNLENTSSEEDIKVDTKEDSETETEKTTSDITDNQEKIDDKTEEIDNKTEEIDNKTEEIDKENPKLLKAKSEIDKNIKDFTNLKSDRSNNLFSKAEREIETADSLQNLAKQKREKANFEKDITERDQLLSDVNYLEESAKQKYSSAQNKLNQIKDEEENYIASNTVEDTNEDKADDNEILVETNSKTEALQKELQNYDNIKNDEGKKLYSEVKNDISIADSLYNLADTKESNLASAEASEKEQIKTEIRELNEIAEIKTSQAKTKLEKLKSTQVELADNTNDAENEDTDIYTEDNETEAKSNVKSFNTQNSIIDNNPEFTFGNSDPDSKIHQYEKEVFNSNYYSTLSKEQNKKLNVMKNSLDNIDDPETKAEVAKQINELEKYVEYSAMAASESKKLAENLKTAAVEEAGEKDLTKENVIINATSYETDNKLELDKDEKSILDNSENKRKEAEGLYSDWKYKKTIIDELKDESEKTEDKKEKKQIEKEIEEKQELADESFEEFNKMYIESNDKLIDTYKNYNDKNRKINNSDDAILANKLENQAEIYSDKADIIRKNIDIIDDKDKKEKELMRAKDLELIALNKLKQAADIYTSLEDEIETTDLVAENNSNADNNESITLTPQEEEMLEEYRDKDHQATTLKEKGDKYLAEAKVMEDKAKGYYDEKKKEKLLEKAQKNKEKAGENLFEAYTIYGKSDSIKYNLYKSQLIELNESEENKRDKLMAREYTAEADLYYQKAEKLREEADKIEDKTEKLKILKSAVEFEKIALDNQEVAVDVLTNMNTDEFVAENTLVKVDRLEALHKPVKVDDVKAIEERRVIENLNLSSKELKDLDKANETKQEVNEMNAEAAELQMKLKEMQASKVVIEDEKEKEKLEKEIAKTREEMFANRFAASEYIEVVNDTKYWIYKDNFINNRKRSNSGEVKEAKMYERNAAKNYSKAKNLRDRSFFIRDLDEAYAMTVEADSLEKLALKQQENAYAIYLDLEPSEELVADLTEKNDETNDIWEDKIVEKSDADISPIENKEDDEDMNDRTAEDNTIPTDTITDRNTINDTDSLIADNLIDNTEDVNTIDNNLDDDSVDDTGDSDENINIEDRSAENETDDNEDEIEIEDRSAEDETEDNTTEDEVEDKNNYITDNTTEDKSTEDNAGDITEETEDSSNDIEDRTSTGVNRDYNTDMAFSLEPVSRYSENNPIPMNPSIPEGIVFKVQIGAFVRAINQDAFEGLSPVTGEKLPNSRFTKYLVGLFKTYEGAREVQNQVKPLGYRDAFVVAYKDGKRIPLYKAREDVKSELDNYNALASNEVDKIKNRTERSNSGTATNDRTASSDKFTDVKSVKGLLYTVQIGVYKKQVSLKDLYNLNPIYKHQTQYGLTRYTTGIYNDYSKADNEKDRVVKLGIKDAFVTAYYNGKRISVTEAKNIELSNSDDIFADTKSIKMQEESINENKVETVNPATANITFRVQVGAYKEEVPNDIVTEFVRLAANKKFDNFIDDKGMTVYTVGDFKDYDKATTQKNVIINEGLKDAFVIALNNGKKIPVQEALRLLK